MNTTMKKIIFALGTVALLASCSGDQYDSWVSPQSNPEEAKQSISLTATPGEAVDFNKVSTDSIKFFSYDLKSDAAVSSEKKFLTLFSADKKASVKLSTDDKNQVAAADLQKAVENLYGKAGVERQVPVTLTDSVLVTSGEGYVLTADFTSPVTLVTPNFSEFFYEIGNESGWSTSHALRSPDMDGKYEGFYYLNGAFKFKPNADNCDGDYEYNGEGKLTQDGSDNIPDPGAGFYMIDVDLNSSTYSLTKINCLSITGDGVGGWPADGDNNSHDKDMTYNVADGCWEWTGTIAASKGFKIRMNHDWTISWGGKAGATDYDNMTYSNGNNLEVAEDGTYEVKFYLTYEGNNKVVITKK